MDSARSLLCDFWNLLNDFPPIVAFFLGLFGSYIVNWFGDVRKDARLRRATRESLADELRINLHVLDGYEEILAPVASGAQSAWPLNQPTTTVIEHALSPAVAAVLSDREQSGLALLKSQLGIVARRLRACCKTSG